MPKDLMSDAVVDALCARLRLTYGWTAIQTDKKKIRQVLWSLLWVYEARKEKHGK